MPFDLAQLKHLSEPIIKLTDVVSKGIGKLYEPTGIRREAKAQSDAAMTTLRGEMEREVLLRAFRRLAFMEERRQVSIESIIDQAAKALPEKVSPEPVSEDWTVDFFDNCKDIGDPEMQKLWARILAGEVTRPGSFSRRTLTMLKSFDQFDARAFTAFCSTCFWESKRVRFTFEVDASFTSLPEEFRKIDLTNHLTTIGMVRPNSHIVEASKTDGWQLDYFDESYVIVAPEAPLAGVPDNLVSIRCLTPMGEELLTIAQPAKSPDLIVNLKKDLALIHIELVSRAELLTGSRAGLNPI